METQVKRQTRKVGVAGGFINQMMGNNSSLPEVGKGATILMYSDRHAYEVIEVNEDSSQCVIRAMETKFVGEAYGDERYEYSSNENNETKTIEWNEKKQCWGEVSYSIEIIKSLANKLFKQYGYGWTEYLPVPKEEIFDKDSDPCYPSCKLVEGVTKEYKNFNKVSIIFGVMEEYCDPTF
ncbi:MAG: hypothetical protein OQK82_07100 [Candidatus Pacearchaeota archaeon]|nr:hypothetical protein [Candidatus Pacearchaeota archaeon]